MLAAVSFHCFCGVPPRLTLYLYLFASPLAPLLSIAIHYIFVFHCTSCNHLPPTSSGTMKIKKKKKAYEPPPDMPRAYLCQLSQRPMSEPVKSTYGR